MSKHHGRAEMPFGKFKGVRLRLIPDDYLSWLTTTFIVTEPQWEWLKASLIAELRFRGMRHDLAEIPEAETRNPKTDPRAGDELRSKTLKLKVKRVTKEWISYTIQRIPLEYMDEIVKMKPSEWRKFADIPGVYVTHLASGQKRKKQEEPVLSGKRRICLE